MSISYSIPTYLSNFTTSVEGRTTAKLKVFYVGETGDGRVFSKEFSEKLIKSLPNCPVVGFFSDLKDDFCGHNSTQYIYGIVPADAEYSFENEDGVEWFVTEVLLYTDRIDNIGEVAQKIVGHPHSLEMHPETTKYEIKMENGKRKIHFVDGSLIGLSVLGMQEKPAFKGSEFFKESTEELREKFENFISFLENKDRGASMNKEQFEKLYSFITLSYEEKHSSLHKAANELVGDSAYAYITQCFDDYCIVEVYDWNTGGHYYKKASYTIDENNQVTFGEFIEVYPRFITEEEFNSLSTASNAFVEDKEDDDKDDKDPDIKEEEKDDEDDFKKDEESEEPVEEEKDPEEEEDFKKDEEGDKVVKEDKEDDSDKEDKEDEFNQNNVNGTSEGESNEPQPTFEEEPKQEQESTSNFTALSNSEREELEALRANQVELEQFRLEKRMNLVESYAEELPADTISAFRELAQTCSYDELEAKLAIEFVKVSKNNKKQNTVAFSFGGVSFGNTTVTSTNSYEDLVKRYTNK